MSNGGTANWASSVSHASNRVSGTCISLYYGTPTAICYNAAWSSVDNNCQSTTPSRSFPIT